MKNLKNLISITILLGGTACGVLAQDAPKPAEQNTSPYPSKKDFNKWSVGINAGMAIGSTDVQPNDWAEASKNFSYGLTVTKMCSHSFGFQGQILKGKLGDQNKTYSYQTDFFEHTINVVYNFGNISFLSSSPKLTMQAFFGLGLNHSKSDLFDTTGTTKVGWAYEPKSTEIALPIGIVMKYKLPKSLTLELGYSLRNINTDKMDRLVSGSTFDRYSYYSFGLSSTIGKKEKDIEWVNPLNTLYEDMADVKEKMAGLGGDKDGDGVADLFDKDSQTPEGVVVDGSGRALDVDGDGVPNHTDEDPFTDKGAVVDEKGKAIDTDGDGVPDHRDLDNNTKPGELVNFQGVKISTGGLSAPGETKVVTVSGGGGGAAFLPSIHFSLNSSKVEYANYEKLAIIANIMKQNGNVKLKATGHADNSGPENYNLTLGEKRAKAVIDHLTKVYGIDASRFAVESKGESDPLAKQGASGMNRRVDFTTN